MIAGSISILSLLLLQDPATAIRALAEAELKKNGHVGFAVGVLIGKEELFFGFGRIDPDLKTAPDAHTIFEIGSITKAFTGDLLAELCAQGTLTLESPAKTLLPPGRSLPSLEGKDITLLHLATHRSGLPRLPSNLDPRNPLDPYADYSPERLTSFLAAHTLRRAPGIAYEYSNLGAGLLGRLLELKTGRDYQTLVLERIATPLGLKDTRIDLSEDQKKRLAPGHVAGGEPAPNWALGSLAGAGALRSSAADMLTFLKAHLDGRWKDATEPRADADGGARVGLGWHLTPLTFGGPTLVWHNGGTGGYRSFAGFTREPRRAVVVLGNSTASVDELAVRILQSLK